MNGDNELSTSVKYFFQKLNHFEFITGTLRKFATNDKCLRTRQTALLRWSTSRSRCKKELRQTFHYIYWNLFISLFIFVLQLMQCYNTIIIFKCSVYSYIHFKMIPISLNLEKIINFKNKNFRVLLESLEFPKKKQMSVWKRPEHFDTVFTILVPPCQIPILITYYICFF